jgi:hypothetical protein
VAKKKKKTLRGALVRSFAENLSSSLLEQHGETVKSVVGRRSGIYVLSKKNAPYYVGLASKLPSRITHHLNDKHHGKWNRFSFYAIGKKRYLKDVETILIRVADPEGNKQKGTFGKHRNIAKKLRKEILAAVKENF